VVIAIAVIAVLLVNLTQRKRQRGELRITRLSEQYKEMQEEMSLRCWIAISRNCGKSAKEKAQAGS
jgi:serine protease SohB